MTDFHKELIAVLQEISNHLETTNAKLKDIEESIDGVGVEPTDMSEASHYIYKVSESIDSVERAIKEHKTRRRRDAF